MKFRPCIDIHGGNVKQIVGGSLSDGSGYAKENFISDKPASYYAQIYKEDELSGGHIILLDKSDSFEYGADLKQAEVALSEYPGGLQIGGGIRADNAKRFIELGASHVIVTSYVFKGGDIIWDNISKLKNEVGIEHIVFDLSCRKKNGEFYIVTDRWQNFTNIKVEAETLDMLAEHCDEFLVHAVDSEGKSSGIDSEIAELLGNWNGIPITYAGGISNMEDIEKIRSLGKGKLDFTVGSTLDLFGGNLSYKKIVEICKET